MKRISNCCYAIFALCLATLAYCRPSEAVGFTLLKIPDQGHALDAGIWYPSQAPTALFPASGQSVAIDAPLDGQALPLIVISHGNGGSLMSERDVALHLAEAGFVVAALTHSGDNVEGPAFLASTRWLTERPRQIKVLVDFMTQNWSNHAHVDPTKIGMFGFSMGGYTTLVLLGAEPDFGLLRHYCVGNPTEVGCDLLRQAGSEVLQKAPTPRWVHDKRIKAAVIAAPGFPYAMRPDTFKTIRTPMQFWSAGGDPEMTKEAEQLLTLRPDIIHHVVPLAEHLAFLTPCSAPVVACHDPEGFDRKHFHDDFNAAILKFFTDTLSVGVQTR